MVKTGKIETSIHLITLGAHKTEREREKQRERERERWYPQQK